MFFNNNISDQMLSIILDSAFGGRHPVKSISLKKNEFGPEAL